MIKRLRTRNFLNLKDVDLELRVNNLVVSPNMSGKSNLVECIRFLTSMATQGVTKASLDRGVFQEEKKRGPEHVSSRNAIEKLTAFRTALIFAAVTGKIDVRELFCGETMGSHLESKSRDS